MQILGIVGSMRKNSHTNTLVNQVISDIKLLEPTTEFDIVYIVDKDIRPCRVVCSKYCSSKPYQCSIADDVSGILQQMAKADALIIGTPLYFRAPPAKFQACVERLISIYFFHEMQGSEEDQSPIKGKPCGLVAVAEYSNPHQMLEYLHDFCTVLKMKPVGIEKFPYLGIAGQGDVAKDTVFNPFEKSKELANAIVREVKGRNRSFDQ
jgi:multimeric flavodoxin WrbA